MARSYRGKSKGVGRRIQGAGLNRGVGGVGDRRMQGAGLNRGVGGCGPQPQGCEPPPHNHPGGHHPHHHHPHHHHPHCECVHCCPPGHGHPNGGYDPHGHPNGNGHPPPRLPPGVTDPTGGWLTDRPHGNGNGGSGIPPVPPNGNGGGIPGGGMMGPGPNAIVGVGWYAHPNSGRLTFKDRKLKKMAGKNKRPLTLGAKQAYRQHVGWTY